MSCSSNEDAGSIAKNDSLKNSTSVVQPASKLWLGKWERRQWQNEASLNITGIKGDSITFALFASNGGHTGEVEGVAVVKREYRPVFK